MRRVIRRTTLGQPRLPIGGSSWSAYTNPIMVWCRLCTRYISNEERHECLTFMSDEYRQERRVQRVVKAKEMIG